MKKRKRVFCKKMFAAMLTASMLTTSSGGIEIAQAASKNEAVIANEDEIQNSSAYGKQSMTDELSGEIAESKRVDRRRSKVLTEDKTDIKSEPKRKTIKKSTKGVRKASAGEITSGDYTLKISGNDATITKYNGNATSGSLLLPTQLDGYTIVEIGNEAFKGKIYPE